MSTRLDETASGLAEFRAIIEHSDKEETHLFDFKERLGSLDDLAEDVMAFANASGGRIFVGVRKDGSLVGASIENTNELIDKVSDKLEPPLRFFVTQFPYEFKGTSYDIYSIRIPRSNYLHCTKSGRYKIRVENGNRPLLPAEIVRLVNDRQIYHWDSSPSYNDTVDNINPVQIQRLKRSATVSRSTNLDRMDDEEVVARLRFVADGQLTKTGSLFISKTPQSANPDAVISYLRYEDDPTTPVQREIIDGTLSEQIEKIESLISAHNSLHQVGVGARYTDVYDIPPRVIHEAITNAVTHRDYSMPGPITVRHRPNELSITSPGSWPPGVTSANFLRHNAPRNPTIAEALRLSGYVERAGIGMPLMFQEMVRYGKRPPEIIADERHVEVILHCQVAAEKMIRLLQELETKGIALSLHHILILWHVHVSPTIDLQQAAHIVQRKDAATRVYLKELIGHRLLERSGYKFRLAGTAYRLEGREGHYTRERGLNYKRQQAMILEHLDRFSTITNKSVRDMLDIDMAAATEVLQRMTAEGLISHGGGRKFRTYERASPVKKAK